MAKKDVLAEALAMLAANGVDTAGMKTYVETDFKNTEALAVLPHQPEIFEVRKCKNCGEPFAHTQKIPAGTKVSFCGDSCRRQDWEKTMKIPYDAVKVSKDIWNGDPPLIISPAQMKNLKRLADWVNRNLEVLESVVDRTTEQELEAIQEQKYHWDLPTPTHTQEPPVESPPAFDPLGTSSTDQSETHTSDDSWLFG